MNIELTQKFVQLLLRSPFSFERHFAPEHNTFFARNALKF